MNCLDVVSVMFKHLNTVVCFFLQEVYHSRRQIKYSKDKMWYLAHMVRMVEFPCQYHIFR